ncbi:Casein kinase I isoform delta [Arachnomyces sp. PD_36]|nr:Casein kinase I isoform delta [Arachnomyces sp. PD_36]
MDENLCLDVHERYRLIRKIGSGGSGAVYEGVDTITDRPVAIKLERLAKDGPTMLMMELALYEILHGGVGIPHIYWSGYEGDFHALVFELLGPSLEDLFNFCGRKFTLKTILLLVDQLIRRMAYLHSRDVIHRDIKPENFLMGLGAKGNTVYTTDLGLSTRFRSARSGAVSPVSPKEPRLHGTEVFASVSGHWGIAQSRRDDMESLGYMIVYFARGSLPWQGTGITDRTARTKKILSMKESITPEELCEGLPEEFARFFTHLRSVDFDEKPNYSYLRRMFQKLFVRMGFEYDFVYDWTILLFLISEESKEQEEESEESTEDSLEG